MSNFGPSDADECKAAGHGPYKVLNGAIESGGDGELRCIFCGTTYNSIVETHKYMYRDGTTGNDFRV